jgi:hypothetical protein
MDLLSVAGQLDDTGLTQLRRQLELLVDTGTVHLVVDLAGVISCDHRLFDVLAWTYQVLAEHQGWMRLDGIAPSVADALGRWCPSVVMGDACAAVRPLALVGEVSATGPCVARVVGFGPSGRSRR